jgi:hypothetical protein
MTPVVEAGNSAQTMRLFIERVYQLGPGGFDGLPKATMLLDNARTARLGHSVTETYSVDVLVLMKLSTCPRV